MDEQKKLALLEDMMELDEGTLAPETALADIEEWDSLARLSLIVLMDEEFGKSITGADVRAFVTVADILACMD